MNKDIYVYRYAKNTRYNTKLCLLSIDGIFENNRNRFFGYNRNLNGL